MPLLENIKLDFNLKKEEAEEEKTLCSVKMPYTIENFEYSSCLSKNANEFLMQNFVRAIPNENFISTLPLQLKNVQVSSFILRKIIAENFIDSILNFDIRCDDVFVCSLPKCGSSWTETIVWLLKHGFNEATQMEKRPKVVGEFENSPVFKAISNELLGNDHSKTLTESAALKMAWSMHFNELESPRIIKTHLPIFALPQAIWSMGTKVIYIVRNPKDTAVSEYHFRRNHIPPTDLTMDDVVNGITNDLWIWSPRVEHFLNFWNMKHLPNILFIAYEELVNHTFETIKRISKFLECNHTDEWLKQLTEFVSFTNMKNNKMLNKESWLGHAEQTFGANRLDSTYT